jgi:hypothetical protein
MSQENVEVVRRWLEAFENNDEVLQTSTSPCCSASYADAWR